MPSHWKIHWGLSQNMMMIPIILGDLNHHLILTNLFIQERKIWDIFNM